MLLPPVEYMQTFLLKLKPIQILHLSSLIICNIICSLASSYTLEALQNLLGLRISPLRFFIVFNLMFIVLLVFSVYYIETKEKLLKIFGGLMYFSPSTIVLPVTVYRVYEIVSASNQENIFAYTFLFCITLVFLGFIPSLLAFINLFSVGLYFSFLDNVIKKQPDLK